MTLWFEEDGENHIINTMDDIPDGDTYVKTENNFTDELKEALEDLMTVTPTPNPIEIIDAINASSGLIDADRIDDGSSVQKFVTEDQAAGASYAFAHLDSSGVKATADIGSVAVADLNTIFPNIFDLSSHTLDDIDDGEEFRKVKNSYTNSNNEIIAIRDELNSEIKTTSSFVTLADGRIPDTILPTRSIIKTEAGDIVTVGGDSINIPSTTDDLTEGATNKYFNGKTLDDLADGSTYKKVTATQKTDLETIITRKTEIGYLSGLDSDDVTNLKAFAEVTVSSLAAEIIANEAGTIASKIANDSAFASNVAGRIAIS